MFRVIRLLETVSGIITLGLAVAFFFQVPWVLDLWPWSSAYTKLSPLSGVFIASILAAIAVPVIWIGVTGEQRAALIGSLNLIVTFSGVAIFMIQSNASVNNSRVLIGAIAFIGTVVMIIAILLYSLRFPRVDQRKMPVPVRLSFALFATILTLVGGALVLKSPNVFPWRLSVEVSVVYGWIFLGAAVAFGYGALVPRWRENAAGQLLGFLAYDLVLIVPFLQHFSTVEPELQEFSLTLYVAVLVYSGAIAIYYEFIHPKTRLFGRNNGAS